MLVRTAHLARWARETRGNLGSASRGGRQVIALAAQWMLTHPLLYRLPASVPALRLGEMVYHRAHDPRPISVAATSILPAALRMDDREVACRRDHAMRLLSRMNGSGRLQPVRCVAGGESGYLRLACIDPYGDAMPEASLGMLRGYPLTVEQHEPLRPNLLPKEKAGKGSVFLRDRLFTMPTHSRVGRVDVARLCDLVARTGPTSALPVSVS